jgi:transcription elongation factor Elf1
MLWVEEKYINVISSSLKLFKRVKHLQYVFRCPICGDSKKNPSKTRGGFYVPPSAQEYNMGCFNCGASMKFSSFLKIHAPNVYDEYIMEKYRETNSYAKNVIIPTEPIKTKKFTLDGLESLAQLDSDHPAIQYLQKRHIPEVWYPKLFYAKSFKKFSLNLEVETTSKKIRHDHPRLVIPFFDKRGNVSRLTARSFSEKEQPKYLYVKINPNGTRLFGLDTVDAKKMVYVVEGPLDSMFIPNSVAIGSADYTIKEIDAFPMKIIVPDNEPRNPAICSSIKKAINKGHAVCLWNSFHGKDIDDMILNGMSAKDIIQLIHESTVQGIQAELKFSTWYR